MSQDVLEGVDAKQTQRARAAMKANFNDADLANSLAEGQGQDSQAYKEKLAAEAAEKKRHYDNLSVEVAVQEHKISLLNADIELKTAQEKYDKAQANVVANAGKPEIAAIYAKAVALRQKELSNLHTELAHPDMNLETLRQMLGEAVEAKKLAEEIRAPYASK